MSRTRSQSFPRLSSIFKSQESEFEIKMSPYQHAPAHSHTPSGTSASSSPVTPTFSLRGHSRNPSSGSSTYTISDSPSTAPTSRTTLHDLVEDPAERDDIYFEHGKVPSGDDLCICDSPFCEHRPNLAIQSYAAIITPPEWSPGDDYFSDGELSGERICKRRHSGELLPDTFTSRVSRHFPSIRKRFTGHRSTASTSAVSLASAAPSRSTSLRLSDARSATIPVLHDSGTSRGTPPFSPVDLNVPERSTSPSRSRSSSQAPTQPLDIQITVIQEEPINREELASTPLLPPMMAEYFGNSSEEITSPLQSPTVATSTARSMVNTPISTPVLKSFSTPPLSARPSATSLRNARMNGPAFAEVPALTIAEEMDPWAIRLGHANFHITPEPYLPQVCDRQACQRLQDDWEAAHVDFLKHEARISEHYGVTSETYKLTQAKWNEINDQWREVHKQVNAEAQATGKSPVFQPIPEQLPVLSMPLLNDPEQPSKFPVVDEKDIVGPMVRYAKMQQERRPSKKPAFLRIFTDPASLLSGRPSLHN